MSKTRTFDIIHIRILLVALKDFGQDLLSLRMTLVR